MKIDKQIILDTILSNKAVADALSVKKVYVYGISEPDVWRLLDDEEACIAPWSVERNHISLEDSKVRVIYKVYLLVLDDEEPNHNKDNPNYVIRKVEIDPEDWFKSKYDAYDKYIERLVDEQILERLEKEENDEQKNEKTI